ncbi:hypothetical protein Fot_04002 [Forsythia ovata]|uniref:Uncharacterized protein n=1 Tax=Forsythia ovata TaxID=205694 RepID=A0ABD1XED1_9LAMI
MNPTGAFCLESLRELCEAFLLNITHLRIARGFPVNVHSSSMRSSLIKTSSQDKRGYLIRMPSQDKRGSLIRMPLQTYLRVICRKQFGAFLHPSLLNNPYFRQKNVRRQGKEKGIVNDKGEKVVPKRAMEDEDDTVDSRRVKRGRMTPPQEKRESTSPPQGTTRTPISAPYRWDELDPTILEKLPALSAMTATSIHKYWTSAWAKVADNADLSEMIKMAEMSTAQSHVLNCELYKVLAMKINELCFTATGAKDIDKLRSENKILRSRLAISDDARAQV